MKGEMCFKRAKKISMSRVLHVNNIGWQFFWTLQKDSCQIKRAKRKVSFQSVQTTRWYLVFYERFLYLFTNKIEPLSKKKNKIKCDQSTKINLKRYLYTRFTNYKRAEEKQKRRQKTKEKANKMLCTTVLKQKTIRCSKF